ncbi:MAG: lipopolysaccharide biosynthesis protein [Planctomycetota bacterium]|jgi:PST family polysaccharide transporter
MTDGERPAPTARSSSDAHLSIDHLEGDLKSRSVRGSAAMVLSEGSRFLIRMLGVAVLARLLTPADFGLLAMVATFTRLIEIFRDLGLATATIQRTDLSQDQVSYLFWVNVAVGVGSTALAAALAPVAAWFYGEPDLTGITIVLATAFLFGGVSVQHQALLRRQMKFSALAWLPVGASVGSVAVGVVAALQGAGYWALVAMSLASAVIMTVGLWLVCGWRPGPPRRGTEATRALLAFGGNLTGTRLLAFFARNLDNVLIGKVWGGDALGLYSKAYQLLMLPIQQLTAPVTGVVVPALSRLQDEPERFRDYYRKAIQALTSLTMPIVVFTFVVADELVLLILGPQWGGTAVIFRLLVPAAFVGTFNGAAGWVWVALNQTDRQLRWGLIATPFYIAAFAVGVVWGPEGVAIAFSVVQCVLRYSGLAYCYRTNFLEFRDLWAAIWRPCVASIAAGALALAVLGSGLVPPQGALASLATALVAYGIAYLVVWLCTPGGRGALASMLALSLEFRSKER